MDLSKLPILALNQVVIYLRLEDMLHCSMASTSWRAALNQNRYWKHFCLRDYTWSLFDCLQNRRCLVEPGFEIPTVEDSTLDPPCEWKQHFMRVQHLKQNIHSGNYYVQELSGEDFPTHIFPVLNEIKGSDGDMFYYSQQDVGTKILNVAGIHSVQSSLQRAFLNISIKSCHLTRDKQTLVMVQGNVMQVMSRTDNDDFVLKYRKLFHKPEVISEDIPYTEHIDHWYNEKFPDDCTPNSRYWCTVIDQMFVVVEFIFQKVWLHVWNLNTGRKENEKFFFTFAESYVVQCHMHECGPIGKILIKFDNFAMDFYTFIYNLTNCEVVQVFDFQNVIWVLDNGLVVTYDDSKTDDVLNFYDISIGSPILRESIPFINRFSFHHNYFMYVIPLGINDKRWLKLHVLNMNTMEDVSPHSIFNIDYNSADCSFHLFFNHIVPVFRRGVKYNSYLDDGKPNVEVWKRSSKLYSMSVPSHGVINPKTYSTKLYFDLFRTEGHCCRILNFW